MSKKTQKAHEAFNDDNQEDTVVDGSIDTAEAAGEAAQVIKTPEEVADEYLNDLKRLQADFANYKKRQQDSQKELAGYLIERLVLDLVPVLDNFRMATNHVPETSKSDPWVVGIQYIEKQLEDVLVAHGMQAIEVQVGDTFDPSIHEALSEEKDETSASEQVPTQHSIATVLQKGYKIGGKVIRPAKVTVK